MRPGTSRLRPGAIVGGAVRHSCFPDEILSARISVPGGCGGSFFPAQTRGRLNPCVFVFRVVGGWRRDGHPPALILVPVLFFIRFGSCVSTVFRRSRRSRLSKFPGHFSSLVSPFPGCAVTWFRAHDGEVIPLSSSGPERGCLIRARTTLRRLRAGLLPGRTSVPSGCTLPLTVLGPSDGSANAATPWPFSRPPVAAFVLRSRRRRVGGRLLSPYGFAARSWCSAGPVSENRARSVSRGRCPTPRRRVVTGPRSMVRMSFVIPVLSRHWS